MIQTKEIINIIDKTGTLLIGDFILASGKKADYYFNSKLLTLNPQGAAFIITKLIQKLELEKISHICGTAYGALPIVSQIVLMSGLIGSFPISAFYHRKIEDIKTHGIKALAEGVIPKSGTQIAVIEDVVTTGDSLLAEILRVKDLGLNVTNAITLLDRNEGGRKVIEENGYKFWALLTVSRAPDGTIKIILNQ